MSDRLAICAFLWGLLSAAMLITGGVQGDWTLVGVGSGIGALSLIFVLLAVWVND